MLRTCSSCGQANRIPAAHLHQVGRCGKCKTALPASASPIDIADAAMFDDPPFCMHAEKFCDWLNEGKFTKAHQLLSPALKETFSVPALKTAWREMTGNAKPEEITLALEQHMVDWPDRKPDDIGWCHFSVSAAEFSEAVTVVIGGRDHAFLITELEFGRP